MNLELPLLLNPYLDGFLDHLRFELVFVGEAAGCTVRDKSPRGAASIAIYNLKRGPLLLARGIECHTAVADRSRIIATLGKTKAMEAFLESLPQRQFPTACIDVLEDRLNLVFDKTRI